MAERFISPDGGEGKPWRVVFQAVIALFLVAALYSESASYLWEQWSGDKMLSHGFVIPVVAMFIAWKRWAIVRSIPAGSDDCGWLLLCASAVLLLAGLRGSYLILSAFSLTLALPGAFLLLQGRQRTLALLFPFLYLQVMLPWLVQLAERMNWPFQLASSRLGIELLHLVGISAYREGTFIHFPRLTLEVAEACSGVGFLVSILAISLPLVYLTQKDWRRAGAVVAAGLPVTLVVNGLRVALVGFMAGIGRTDILHGPAHIFQGWFVAQFGIVLLFVLNFATYRMDRREIPPLVHRPLAQTDNPAGLETAPTGAGRRNSLLVLLFLILLLLAKSLLAPRSTAAPGFDPATIPHSMGSWQGRNDPWISVEDYFSDPDLAILHSYESSGGKKVLFLMVRYEQQIQGKRIFSRIAPLVEPEKALELPAGTPGGEAVSFTRLELHGRPLASVHWFRTHDRNVSGKSAARIRSFFDGLLAGRNDTTFFLIASPYNRGADEKDAVEAITEFHALFRDRLDRLFLSRPETGVDEVK